MGLLDRFKRDRNAVPAKLTSDAQAARLQDGQNTLNAAIAANPGALPDMNADPSVLQEWAAGAAADAERIQRIQRDGVQAAAVIRSIRPTGGADLGGGREMELDVVVQSASGVSHESRVRQNIMPAHMPRLTVGAPVTVKYDPGDPGAALMVDW